MVEGLGHFMGLGHCMLGGGGGKNKHEFINKLDKIKETHKSPGCCRLQSCSYGVFSCVWFQDGLADHTESATWLLPKCSPCLFLAVESLMDRSEGGI